MAIGIGRLRTQSRDGSLVSHYVALAQQSNCKSGQVSIVSLSNIIMDDVIAYHQLMM